MHEVPIAPVALLMVEASVGGVCHIFAKTPQALSNSPMKRIGLSAVEIPEDLGNPELVHATFESLTTTGLRAARAKIPLKS